MPCKLLPSKWESPGSFVGGSGSTKWWHSRPASPRAQVLSCVCLAATHVRAVGFLVPMPSKSFSVKGTNFRTRKLHKDYINDHAKIAQLRPTWKQRHVFPKESVSLFISIWHWAIGIFWNFVRVAPWSLCLSTLHFDWKILNSKLHKKAGSKAHFRNKGSRGRRSVWKRQYTYCRTTGTVHFGSIFLDVP